MNFYDAAKILNLSGELTPDLIKAAFIAACKKYHPDINPAGAEMMKVVNAAYDILRDYEGTVQEEQTDYGELFNEALNAVLPLPEIFVEICGVWMWVTGDTRQHKTTLKQAGFKWASKKKAWHFRPDKFRSRSRGNTSLAQIREKYGSKRPSGQVFARLGGNSHA